MTAKDNANLQAAVVEASILLQLSAKEIDPEVAFEVAEQFVHFRQEDAVNIGERRHRKHTVSAGVFGDVLHHFNDGGRRLA